MIHVQPEHGRSLAAIADLLSLAFALRDDDGLRRAVGMGAGRTVVHLTRGGAWLEVGGGACLAHRVRPPGLPLSADDWNGQMMFFLQQGYRAIAHDRRGRGRSSQTAIGNEMDTYVADVNELTAALDLCDAIHIGHLTGGGEAARYVAGATPGRVAKAVLIRGCGI